MRKLYPSISTVKSKNCFSRHSAPCLNSLVHFLLSLSLVLQTYTTLAIASCPNWPESDSKRNKLLAAPPQSDGESHQADQTRAAGMLGKLPLSFEPNRGQTAASVRFLSRANGANLFLASNEAVMSLRGSARAAGKDCLRMSLVGASSRPEIEGLDQLPSRSNYLLGSNKGKWLTNIPQFAKVIYRQVYPGIDLIYHGNQQRIEYDFVIAPGANPDVITLKFKGARRLRLDDCGDLIAETKAGEMQQHHPVIYQEKAGTRVAIQGRFVISGRRQVRFEVGSYDRSRELVIDPTLAWSTYIGASGDDNGQAIAIGGGYAFITGDTADVATDYPATGGSYDTSQNGGTDVFVTKLALDGSSLVYSTFLGGSSGETGYGIAVLDGYAYVTGVTASTNFPTTAGAYDTSQNGSNDAFVTKLSQNGASLMYSTFLGGSSADYASSITVNCGGEAFVTGQTSSSGFPTSNCATGHCSKSTSNDAFVSKLSSTGNSLGWSIYLGGNGSDSGNAIALGGPDTVYVVGDTFSTNFPAVTTSTGGAANGYDSTFNSTTGSRDVFISKVGASGGSYKALQSTYIGGDNDNTGLGVAVSSDGSVYITGTTLAGVSTSFPTTNGAYDTTHNGDYDVFVSSFSGDLTALSASTFIGTNDFEEGRGIALCNDGVYVTGDTFSSTFPPGTGFVGNAGYSDAFVLKLSTSLTSLTFSRFLGGSMDDVGNGIAAEGASAYVVGTTYSTDFTTTAGAYDTSHNGNADVFVSKVAS
ncbi:MAG: hypothetical protein U0Z53_25080 [Blastocatellia bacterium]